MNVEEAMEAWTNHLAQREKQVAESSDKHRTINGVLTAGVDECPECGGPLLPDAKCSSCGWNPKGTNCKQCGKRFDGEKCDDCGWYVGVLQCRNCSAFLTDNHIYLKTFEDDWVWKTCAYCRWPIEKYLWTHLGQIEPYIKPYESHESYHGTGAGIFSTVIIGLLCIFIFMALIGPMGGIMSQISSNLTASHTGFTPNANITNITTSNNGMGLMPMIQLFSILFIFIGLIFVAKLFKGNI